MPSRSRADALSAYWVNTGGHSLLKRLFFGREADIKPNLDMLMRGEPFYAHIDEFLTFHGLETNPNAVLSLLYFAGYVRAGESKTVDYLSHHRTVYSQPGSMAGLPGNPPGLVPRRPRQHLQ